MNKRKAHQVNDARSCEPNRDEDWDELGKPEVNISMRSWFVLWRQSPTQLWCRQTIEVALNTDASWTFRCKAGLSPFLSLLPRILQIAFKLLSAPIHFTRRQFADNWMETLWKWTSWGCWDTAGCPEQSSVAKLSGTVVLNQKDHIQHLSKWILPIHVLSRYMETKEGGMVK